MHVHPAGHPSTRALTAQPAPALPPAPAADAPAQTRTDSVDLSQDVAQEKMPGVVRNLFSGHYKGVADVRLRIVHAEKLAQYLTPAPAEPQTPAPTVQDVKTLVADQLSTLPDVGELTEEQTAAVTTATDAFSAALDAIDPDAADPVEALTAAADEIVASLTATLVGDSTEPTGYETLLGTLSNSLNELIAKFSPSEEEPAEPALTLPPLSEPTGKGKAYAKFLAEYEQIYGLAAPPADEPAEDPAPEPLDLVA